MWKTIRFEVIEVYNKRIFIFDFYHKFLVMEVIWQNENFVVRKENGFHSLFSKRPFQVGEVVCEVTGEEISFPNRYSVQVARNLHINVKEPVKYINHHCTGNIELKEREFLAISKIEIGDEISFNYNSTEDILAEPFNCFRCGKEIKGRVFESEFSLSNIHN